MQFEIILLECSRVAQLFPNNSISHLSSNILPINVTFNWKILYFIFKAMKFDFSQNNEPNIIDC